MLATAALSGSLGGLLGGPVLILGLYLKARLEERFLREELGAQGYDAYAQRVPMLVPFVRPAR
jgi:protein-S-isoprenylcysteine O-methyltransferase Ste14